MDYLVSVHTDIGIKKPTNQDSLCVKTASTPEGNVAMTVVCDGMGGLSKGELASATVVRSLYDWFNNVLPEILRDSYEDGKIYDTIEEVIREQNIKLSEYGEKNSVKLGTTLTLFLIIYDKYYIAQIGDSRAYKINSRLTMLTRDQSLVAREVERGNITLEQAKTDPRRNILLQCIGASKEIKIEFTSGDLEKNTSYMVCSDGLIHKLSEAELMEALHPDNFNSEDKIQSSLIKLVDLVKQRNELDNISIILLKTF